MVRTRLVGCVASLAALGNLPCLGCAAPDLTGTEEAALVGGLPTFGYPAVMYVTHPEAGYCSGERPH